MATCPICHEALNEDTDLVDHMEVCRVVALEKQLKDALLQNEAMRKSLDEVYKEHAAAVDELNAANRLNDELCGVLHALHLFVDVYEGKVLDQKAAQELIRKYAKRSEVVGKTILEIQESQKRNHDSKPGRGETPNAALPCLPLEAGKCGCAVCVAARDTL